MPTPEQQAAIEALRDAIQQCEDQGMKVFAMEQFITGAVYNEKCQVVDLV